MSQYLLQEVRCPQCKGELTIKFQNKESQVLSCSCFNYPYVGGILYLKRDRKAKKASYLITQSRVGKAIITLLGVRRLLTLPVWLILMPNPIDFLIVKIFKKNIYELVNFKGTVLLLTLFSYPKSWAKYLINREKDTSFNLSVFVTKRIKNKTSRILDLGCGVGHLIPSILKRVKPENLYALDNSFLSLLIADRFFSKPGVNLICADVESSVPFRNETFNLVIASDSFHYIKEKKYYLSETFRILTDGGLLSIVHTINTSKRVYGNILGIRAKKIQAFLKAVGYLTVNIYKDDGLWDQVIKKASLNFNKPFITRTLKEKDAYTLFASKKRPTYVVK